MQSLQGQENGTPRFIFITLAGVRGDNCAVLLKQGGHLIAGPSVWGSHVNPLTNDQNLRIIQSIKLSIDVTMDGCLPPCGPEIKWQLVVGVTLALPRGGWLQAFVALNQDKQQRCSLPDTQLTFCSSAAEIGKKSHERLLHCSGFGVGPTPPFIT